jgi:cytoskeletal protein CcmA (bactofilin family)
MFGVKRENKNPTKGLPVGGSVSHNSLVKGTLVKGDVKSETDIRVDGVIEGRLDCDAKVVIGPTGHVQGSVTCRDAVIEGRVEGNVLVTDLLNLRKTAQLTGDIDTNKLIVEAGAIFAGNVRMGKAVANHASGNQTVRLQAG